MNKLTTLLTGILMLLATSIQSQIDNSCTVLQNNTSLVFNKNGILETRQVALLIHNKSGDCFTTIRLPYSKLEPIGLAVAQIEQPNGTIVRKLKPKDAVEKSDIASYSLYEDRMVYEFDLRHNVYPYVVRYEYTQKSSNYIQLCNWTPMHHPHLKTEKATLTIQVPSTKKVNAYVEQIGEAAITTNADESTIYTWQGNYSPMAKELYSVNRYNTVPKVIATTPDFFYGINGNLSSWANLGEWYSKLSQGLDIITTEEKAIVDRLKASSSSTNELVDKLYKHLQTSKRYINVSTDIGGMKPHPANYVCTNGYGDCKALSNYMKAILAYAGINSNLVLVYADEKPLDLPAAFPMMMFNHAILCVPNQGDTIWLECTSSINPTGYLGDGTQNRYVLLVDGPNSKLVRTPKLTPQQCLVSRNCHIAKNGNTNYNITFNGPSFEVVGGIDNGVSQHWHEYVLDHYLMPSFDAKEWRFIKPTTDTPQISLVITGNWGQQSEAQSDVQSYLLSIPQMNIPQLPKNPNRLTPICFPYPTMVVDTTVIETPNGFTKLANAESKTIVGDVASYSKTMSINGNAITIIRQLSIPEGTYPPSSYQDIATHFQAIKKADKERLILNK